MLVQLSVPNRIMKLNTITGVMAKKLCDNDIVKSVYDSNSQEKTVSSIGDLEIHVHQAKSFSVKCYREILPKVSQR